MNNYKRLLALSFSISLFAASCQPSSHSNNNTNQDTTKQVKTVSINLVGVDSIKEFPDAQLSIDKVTATEKGDSVNVAFKFNVKNYQLKNQTSDSTNHLCSNSSKGQHIHFILDNSPYAALYEPTHEITVAKNSDHYVLAFLSRSYHLSLKNKGAAVLYHFHIDEKGKMQKLEIPNNPMVFYSRPKGDYIGQDTKNVLLDFYVWNVTLGAEYLIKADINAAGKDTIMMLSEWKPYFFENLPMGKTTINLTMIKDGKKVDGDNTSVSRTINLAQDEPMK